MYIKEKKSVLMFFVIIMQSTSGTEQFFLQMFYSSTLKFPSILEIMINHNKSLFLIITFFLTFHYQVIENTFLRFHGISCKFGEPLENSYG